MITWIDRNTGGARLGFATLTGRDTVDHALGPRIRELAGDAYRQSALVDRESSFNAANARQVIGLEEVGEGARAIVDGEPSELILSRVELATLFYAMPRGR